MSYSTKKNYAYRNSQWQGLDLSKDFDTPQHYSGIDRTENAVVNDDHIYISLSDKQHEMVEKGEKFDTSGGYPTPSGYFTDTATINRSITGPSQLPRPVKGSRLAKGLCPILS